MTVQTLPPPTAKRSRQGMECRVWERFSCELQTSCQPIAARSDRDLMWPAVVRDISVGGMGVVLHRRFERGAGLAIEIPQTETYSGDTLLAKVMHVTPMGEGAWLLGCAFVSQLSDDGLTALLQMAQAQHTQPQIDIPAPAEPNAAALFPDVNETPIPEAQGGTHFLLAGVDFEGGTERGQVKSIPIRRLYLSGSWPLAPGTLLRVRPAKGPLNQTAIKLRVLRCVLEENRWKVVYSFTEKPPAGWLALLGH